MIVLYMVIMQNVENQLSKNGNVLIIMILVCCIVVQKQNLRDRMIRKNTISSLFPRGYYFILNKDN